MSMILAWVLVGLFLIGLAGLFLIGLAGLFLIGLAGVVAGLLLMVWDFFEGNLARLRTFLINISEVKR